MKSDKLTVYAVRSGFISMRWQEHQLEFKKIKKKKMIEGGGADLGDPPRIHTKCNFIKTCFSVN
jgi:hypothetical protein